MASPPCRGFSCFLTQPLLGLPSLPSNAQVAWPMRSYSQENADTLNNGAIFIQLLVVAEIIIKKHINYFSTGLSWTVQAFPFLGFLGSVFMCFLCPQERAPPAHGIVARALSLPNMCSNKCPGVGLYLSFASLTEEFSLSFQWAPQFM